MVAPDQVDAVFISHGPSTITAANLNPCCGRGRCGTDPAPPLPVVVRAARRAGCGAGAWTGPPGCGCGRLHAAQFTPGEGLHIGPFPRRPVLPPLAAHQRPACGSPRAARLIAYTGDSGPSTRPSTLARGAAMLVARPASFDQGSADKRRHLSRRATAASRPRAAGRRGNLMLTHLIAGATDFTMPHGRLPTVLAHTTARSASHGRHDPRSQAKRKQSINYAERRA